LTDKEIRCSYGTQIFTVLIFFLFLLLLLLLLLIIIIIVCLYGSTFSLYLGNALVFFEEVLKNLD
jgi:hypothetical protein